MIEKFAMQGVRAIWKITNTFILIYVTLTLIEMFNNASLVSKEYGEA